MTKDVLLRICGIQFLEETAGGIDGPVEIITPGSYFEKNGRHYLQYDEVLEGQEGVIRNLIKINGDSLEVIKKGAVNVHMVFEENKKNVTYYSTPFGNLLIGIRTAHMDFQKKNDSMDVKVEYALEINYEFLADCSLSINVQSKA